MARQISITQPHRGIGRNLDTLSRACWRVVSRLFTETMGYSARSLGLKGSVQIRDTQPPIPTFVDGGHLKWRARSGTEHLAKTGKRHGNAGRSNPSRVPQKSACLTFCFHFAL